VAGSQAHSHGESAANDAQHQQRRGRYNHRMTQVKLSYPAGLAADKNDIHKDGSFKAVIVFYTGA
jgi:hypothetical protein